MIPKLENELLNTTLEVETIPSKSYKMKIEQNNISGFVDNLESMQQVIYKILNTERYEYNIYSWNYGIELKSLFEQPISYVCPEAERRITEALVQDDRIEFVDDFEFDYSIKNKVNVSFIVHTIYGNLKEEMVVNY